MRRQATPNAAPEWQASSLGLRSNEPVVACPLKGLVRSVALSRIRQQGLTSSEEFAPKAYIPIAALMR